MNPFMELMPKELNALPEPVRSHFMAVEGTHVFEGRMDRVWHTNGMKGALAFPALWLGSRMNLLFADTGEDIPFRLENRIWKEDGRWLMAWNRTFTFSARVRKFDAVMAFEANRGLVDWLGKGKRLEVDLHPSIAGEAIEIRSGRQWLCIVGLKIPLPGFISGEARIREWRMDEHTCGIRVEVWNPLLGLVFGYEGRFQKVNHA